MKTGNAMRATSTLAMALSLVNRDDLGSPKQTASPTVAAHDPSLHGVGGRIVAAAVPAYTTIESAGAADVGGTLKLEAGAASWHTHPVQLATGAGASNFCIVSLGTSQAGIAIVGDEIRVNIAEHQAGLSAEDLDVAAAFIVQPEAGCAATGLGVKILNQRGQSRLNSRISALQRSRHSSDSDPFDSGHARPRSQPSRVCGAAPDGPIRRWVAPLADPDDLVGAQRHVFPVNPA